MYLEVQFLPRIHSQCLILVRGYQGLLRNTQTHNTGTTSNITISTAAAFISTTASDSQLPSW
jgi:hypothetical protein